MCKSSVRRFPFPDTVERAGLLPDCVRVSRVPGFGIEDERRPFPEQDPKIIPFLSLQEILIPTQKFVRMGEVVGMK